MRKIFDTTNASLDLHRTDIDYNEQGWIAVIEEVTSKRKKLVLSPSIMPASLFGKRKVVGEVTVVEEKQLDGDYIVKEFHLNSVESVE